MRLRTPLGEATFTAPKRSMAATLCAERLAMQLCEGGPLVVKRTHVSSQIQLGIRVDARCMFIFISLLRARGLFQISAVRMHVVVASSVAIFASILF